MKNFRSTLWRAILPAAVFAMGCTSHVLDPVGQGVRFGQQVRAESQTDAQMDDVLDLLMKMDPGDAAVRTAIMSHPAASGRNGLVYTAPSTRAAPSLSFSITAAPPYLVSGGQLLPLDSSMSVSSLSDGDMGQIPFRFLYDDSTTQVTGIITYSFFFAQATTEFVVAMPPYQIVVDQHQTVAIEGTVINAILDALDGQSGNNGFFEGAFVAAYRDTDQSPTVVTDTDAQGRYSLTVTGGYTYRVEAYASGWQPTGAAVWAPSSGAVTGVNFDLMPLATAVSGSALIYGAMTEQAGSAVSGAIVAIADPAGNLIPTIAAARTNSLGEYALLTVPAGEYRLRLQAGAATAYSEPFTVATDDAREARRIHMDAVFPNHRPTIACMTDFTAEIGSVVRIDVNGADADGDPLAYSYVVSGAVLLPHQSWQPYADIQFGQAGLVSIQATVSDGALSTQCTASVNVGSRPVLATGFGPAFLRYVSSGSLLGDDFDDGQIGAAWRLDNMSGWQLEETAGALHAFSGPLQVSAPAETVRMFAPAGDISQGFRIETQINVIAQGQAFAMVAAAGQNGAIGVMLAYGPSPMLRLMAMNQSATTPWIPSDLDGTYAVTLAYDRASGQVTATVSGRSMLDGSAVNHSLSVSEVTDVPADLGAGYQIGVGDMFNFGATLTEASAIDFRANNFQVSVNAPAADNYAVSLSPFQLNGTTYDDMPQWNGGPAAIYGFGEFQAGLTQAETPVIADGISTINIGLIHLDSGENVTLITSMTREEVAANPGLRVDGWIGGYFAPQGPGNDYAVAQ